MAKADEIIDNANKSLNICLNNDDYQYLVANVNRLSKSQLKECTYLYTLNYINGFKNAVENRELVHMRRNLIPTYLDSIHYAREQVEALINNQEFVISSKQVNGQFSLFEINYEEDYEIE